MKQQLKSANIKAKRIRGIYGKDVSMYNMKIIKPTYGMVGCFLSHIKTWKYFITKTTDDYAVVFEDDIMILKPDKFKDSVTKLIRRTPDDFDILYIGCFEDDSMLNKVAYYTLHPTRKREYINKYVYKPKLSLGLYSYILTRKGAEKLLSLFFHIYTHIDIQVNIEISKNNVIGYVAMKKLIKQNMGVDESHNAKIGHPYHINKYLNRYKDDNGIPISYKLCVPLMGICNKYDICGWTILFLLFGVICSRTMNESNYKKMILFLVLLLIIDSISSNGDPSILVAGVMNLFLFSTPTLIKF
jgi:GR25 family glycosyltransferase involved in LPS biosynthesis